jgi:heat-inducible transcriptional repressor
VIKIILDERKKRILEAIIEEYNETAEPVGSNKIALNYDLKFSPATIRSEMASLEELGYLEQPHTSAGRIPSNKGYRAYIDNIMRERHLSAKEKEVIDYSILQSDVVRLDSLIKEATSIITRLTNYASIAIGPSMDNCKVEEIKIVKIGQSSLLIVILADTGVIKESVIKCDTQITEENIYILNNYMNYKLRGMSFLDVYENINAYVESEISNTSGNVSSIITELCNLLVENGQNIYMEGTMKLLGLPELKKEETLKNFLNIIETKDAIKELLKTGYDGTINVYIGQESSFDDLKDFTIITFKHSINEKEVGTIGVIGPTRMDYKKVIPTIKYLGNVIQEKINKGGEG